MNISTMKKEREGEKTHKVLNCSHLMFPATVGNSYGLVLQAKDHGQIFGK